MSKMLAVAFVVASLISLTAVDGAFATDGFRKGPVSCSTKCSKPQKSSCGCKIRRVENTCTRTIKVGCKAK